jgi:hypothetical protein
LQPVVLGIGLTRPSWSAADSVNQIELQSGPTVIPTGPELAVCARYKVTLPVPGSMLPTPVLSVNQRLPSGP